MTLRFDKLETGEINNQMEGHFMPRQARNREKNQPHHIMCRSIDELLLFNTDEDKEYYLKLIKASALIFRIEILSYCLMDNHVHMLVHPRKGDISKFMHAINNPYAKYYNRINSRRGHLFSERFKNIVIKDLNQLLRNSTYIHNNAKDLLYKGYKSIEDYPYSSIKDYTKPNQGRGLAKPHYLFNAMGGTRVQAVNHYKVLLEIQSQGREAFEQSLTDEFKKVHYETDKKTILRDAGAEMVVKVVAKLMKITNSSVLKIKHQKKYRKYKALIAICLRIYCDMSLSEMTKVFKNHTSSTIGAYAREGFHELESDTEIYNQIEAALSF